MEASDASPSSEERSLPRTFGRYTLFDFVGRGGMAEIYLARATTDLGGSRLFVVKEILPEFSENTRFADMLIHEAKLAARLTHANIVTVFDLGRENGRLYIAMEYVEGLDLGALLRACTRQKIPLPLELALTIMSSTLRGLDYAHRRTDDEGKPFGIVHRDVSPSNVLVSFGGDVKVCDFGIAHANVAMAAPGGTIDEDAIKGKAGYMSPEQASGRPLDARADVFATGIVLWELLAGRKLYKAEKGESRTRMLEMARQADVPALASKGLPQESRLFAIVEKALSKNPDDRFPSAHAMMIALEGYAIDTGQLASSIKLSDWLVANFGAQVLEQRRIRERAAAALQRGPLVELKALPRTPAPPAASHQLMIPSVPESREPQPPSSPDVKSGLGLEAMAKMAMSPMPPKVQSQPLSVPQSIAGQAISVTPSAPSSTTALEREIPDSSVSSAPGKQGRWSSHALTIGVVLMIVVLILTYLIRHG